MMSWKTLLVGFLAGLLAGAGWGAWYAAERGGRGDRWERREEKVLKRFTRELDLTPEQRVAVGELLRGQRERIKAAKEEVRPRMEAIREETRARIRALLKPEQAEAFERFEEKRRRRHGERPEGF
jgi:Spy/CpxP family protein refolding chaperone